MTHKKDDKEVTTIKFPTIEYVEQNGEIFFRLDKISQAYGFIPDTSVLVPDDIIVLNLPKKGEKRSISFVTISGIALLLDQSLSDQIVQEEKSDKQNYENISEKLENGLKEKKKDYEWSDETLYEKMRNFLDTPVDENWDEMNYEQRLAFFVEKRKGSLTRNSFTLDELVLEGLQRFDLYKNEAFYQRIRLLMKKDPYWIYKKKITGLYPAGEGYERRHAIE